MSRDDTANYSVDDGKSGFVEDGGLQTTKLTLKAGVVDGIISHVAYKCSVQSGEFSNAPAFSTDVPIGMYLPDFIDSTRPG